MIAGISIAVVARLVTLIPGIRDLRMTRRTGRILRIIGWTLVVVTPIVTVVATAFAEDSFVGWLAVSTPLAYAAVVALGFGLATRPRVDAKVIMPDGATNEAWSIDALVQVRNVSVDDPRIQLERASSAEFGEFIMIADRTGSGLASAIAWVVQALFNLIPWQLQVTVLDGRSAIATLRRNGRVFPEVELDLDWGDPGSDQHRKLLALAAAFTALSMAERYPDMQGGGPAATKRRSIGYLGLARMASGAERRHYLDRATDADRASLLASTRALPMSSTRRRILVRSSSSRGAWSRSSSVRPRSAVTMRCSGMCPTPADTPSPSARADRSGRWCEFYAVHGRCAAVERSELDYG